MLILIGLIIIIVIKIIFKANRLNKEKKLWNNGHCSCGKPWEFALIDTGRKRKLYKCRDCNKAIEIYTTIDSKPIATKNNLFEM